MTSQATEFTATAEERRTLDQLLYILIGRSVKEVRITRVRWPEGKRWVAMVIGATGHEVPLYESGLHHQAASILQDAFPHANWGRAQDYDAATGVLREHVTPMPASLRGER